MLAMCFPRSVKNASKWEIAGKAEQIFPEVAHLPVGNLRTFVTSTAVSGVCQDSGCGSAQLTAA